MALKAPSTQLINIHRSTVKNLRNNMDTRFPTEGKSCPKISDGASCPEGCLRWVWNCQLMYKKRDNIFEAQSNRCSVSSKLYYNPCNDVVSTFPSPNECLLGIHWANPPSLNLTNFLFFFPFRITRL